MGIPALTQHQKESGEIEENSTLKKILKSENLPSNGGLIAKILIDNNPHFRYITDFSQEIGVYRYNDSRLFLKEVNKRDKSFYVIYRFFENANELSY